MSIELSKEQESVKDCILDWYSSGKPRFVMGGYAGTGKTTLISYIRNHITTRKSVAFVCYTAKASLVLKEKLKASFALKKDDFCGTIHSMIYEPILDDNGKIIEWKLKSPENIKYDLIIIDEASMVSKDIYEDLLAYDIPILAVGDCFQLPPIEGKFNIMDNADETLYEIHRQAAGNPIIGLSMDIRTNGTINFGTYGPGVAKVRGGNNPAISSFLNNTKSFSNTMVLCAFNKTRVDINKAMRKRFGYDGVPQVGERIICLKNNYFSEKCRIVNGGQGFIKAISDSNSHYEIVATMDGESDSYIGPIDKGTFLCDKPEMNTGSIQRIRIFPHLGIPQIEAYESPDYFDYGYCLSVHKAQGSQCKRVMVIEQYSSYWSDEDRARWLYTAITRAEEQLLIVVK